LSSAAPAGATANTSATAIEIATAMRRNMAPSLSGLAADRFARLSANAANKESDNLCRRARRSAGRYAAESFARVDPADVAAIAGLQRKLSMKL
jgi:hypothetical protein